MNVWPVAISMAMLLAPSFGCERADRTARERTPASRVTLTLRGSPELPEVRIAVPRFGARWSELPPSAYWLRGGSVGEGFKTDIFVGAKSGCRERQCPNETLVEEADRRIQTCTTARERTIVVEHHRAGSAICCTASWTAYGELTEDQRRIARGIEEACTSVR